MEAFAELPDVGAYANSRAYALKPPIIKTNEWGALSPKFPLTRVGKPTRIIVHGTDGHHPEIANPANESIEECIRFAREIQHFHMYTRDWDDSGHNFLVCRNGIILVGRHLSYTQIVKGRMVRSAHCPTQNDNPGIEFEHQGNESLTPIQMRMGTHLMAWICRCTGMTGELQPHQKYFKTACPTPSILKDLPEMRKEVKLLLK